MGELTEPAQKQLKVMLAAQRDTLLALPDDDARKGKQPDTLAVRITSLASYLTKGACLAQLEVGWYDEPFRTLLVWTIIHNETVYLLDGQPLKQGQERPKWWSTVELDRQTRLEGDNEAGAPKLVSEYLRDFWWLEMEPSEGLLLTEVRDVEWLTPLPPKQLRSLEAAIQDYKQLEPVHLALALLPSVSLNSSEHLHLKALVLQGTNLYERHYHLRIDNQNQLPYCRLDGTKLVEAANDPGTKQPVVKTAGLPANHRRAEHVPGPPTWYYNQLYKEWHVVDDREALTIVREVNRQLRPHIRTGVPQRRVRHEETESDAPDTPTVPLQIPRYTLRRRYLRFLNAQHIKLQDLYNGQARDIELLWRPAVNSHPALVLPLSGELATTRQALVELRNDPHPTLHLESAEEALVYMDLIYATLYGPKGSVMLKSQQDALTHYPELKATPWYEKITPPKAATPDRFGRYQVDAWVLARVQGRPGYRQLHRLCCTIADDYDVQVKSFDAYGDPFPGTSVAQPVLNQQRMIAADANGQGPANTALATGTHQPDPNDLLGQLLASPQDSLKEDRCWADADLENLVYKGGLLQFVRCRFRGPLRLNAAELKTGVTFKDCVFEQGLELKRCQDLGRVYLENCTILGEPLDFSDSSPDSLVIRRCSSEKGMRARRMTTRLLRLIDVVFDGETDLLRAHVTGLLALGGSEQAYTPNASLDRQSLSQVKSRREVRRNPRLAEPLNGWAHFRGHVNVTATQANEVQLHYMSTEDDIHLDSVIVQKYISCAFCWFEADLILHHAVVEKGYVWLTNIQVRGALYARYLRVGTSFYLDSVNREPSRIMGRLCLVQAVVSQVVRIRHSHIGSIEARGLETNSVRIGGGRALGDYVGAWDETRLEDGQRLPYAPLDWSPKELVYVRNLIDLSVVRVAQHLELAGVSNQPPRYEGDNTTLNVRIRLARVGGTLRFYIDPQRAHQGYLLPQRDSMPRGLRLETNGSLDLSDTQVEGHVLCSYVRCSGSINLGVMHIHGSLIFESQAVHNNEQHRDMASARCLQLSGTVCEHTADLSGLRLAEQTPHKPDALRTGHIEARHARFPERLVLTSERPTDSIHRPHAIVPGALDLTEAEIGTLLLSRDSFHEDKEAHDDGIVLERAVVDKIKVLLPQRPADVPWKRFAKNPNNYPRRMALVDTTVRWWEFTERTASRDAEESRGQAQLQTEAEAISPSPDFPEPAVSPNPPPKYKPAFRDQVVPESLNLARWHIAMLNASYIAYWGAWRTIEDKFRAAGVESAANHVHQAAAWADLKADHKQRRKLAQKTKSAPGRPIWLRRMVGKRLRAMDKRVPTQLRRFMRAGRLILSSWHAPGDWLTEIVAYQNKLPIWGVLIVLLGLAFSTWAFSDPENLEPTEQALAQTEASFNRERATACELPQRPNLASPTSVANPIPTGAARQDLTPPCPTATPPAPWAFVDAFFVAVRFHIPLAALTDHDAWEPKDEGDLALPLSKTYRLRVPVTPERYANLVLALHWLLVPFLVTLVVQKRFRQY